LRAPELGIVPIGSVYIVRELLPIFVGIYLYMKDAIPCYWSFFPALHQTMKHLVLGLEDGKTIVDTPKVGETVNF